MCKIVSWNINSVTSKFPFLQTLINDMSPIILCLQETKLDPSKKFYLKQFSSFRCDNLAVGNAKGGFLITVSKNVHSEEIPINSPFQAVAVKVMLDTTIKICSIYINPSDNLTQSALLDLLNQLPRPFILTGDFNAHNPLWVSIKLDNKGKEIESLLNLSDTILLNSGLPTRLDIYSGSFSSIDLSFCSSSLTPVLNWTMGPDLYSSDHFPQVIDIITSSLSSRLGIFSENS